MSATLLPTLAVADLINFNLAGQIYTKWLYRNNDNQGVLSYGNPFWPDNMAGDNGVSSEFQLLVEGRVGDYVQAGVRIKSRFGALWQDWWENGDIKYDQVENTSGESLGMNRAQYMAVGDIGSGHSCLSLGWMRYLSVPVTWGCLTLDYRQDRFHRSRQWERDLRSGPGTRPVLAVPCSCNRPAQALGLVQDGQLV